MNSLILQGPTLQGRLPLLQRGQGLAGGSRKVGGPRRGNDDRCFVEDVAEDAQQLEAMVDDVTGDAVETLFVGNGRRQKRRVAGSGRVGCRRRRRRRRRPKKFHAQAGKQPAREGQELSMQHLRMNNSFS